MWAGTIAQLQPGSSIWEQLLQGSTFSFTNKKIIQTTYFMLYVPHTTHDEKSNFNDVTFAVVVTRQV